MGKGSAVEENARGSDDGSLRAIRESGSLGHSPVGSAQRIQSR